jgi:hypothetical protein
MTVKHWQLTSAQEIVQKVGMGVEVVLGVIFLFFMG